MVGIASRKENSTIVRRGTPMSEPPTIVAADRDTPGIMATHWKRPICTAFAYVIVEKSIASS
jgi:hypothetical protein